MSSGISSPLHKKKEKSVSRFWAARVKAASIVFFLIIEMPQKLYFISLSAFVTSMSSFSKFTKRAELKTSSRLWSVDSRRRTEGRGVWRDAVRKRRSCRDGQVNTRAARRTDLAVGQNPVSPPVPAPEGTLWLQPPVLPPWHWEETSEHVCQSNFLTITSTEQKRNVFRDDVPLWRRAPLLLDR